MFRVECLVFGVRDLGSGVWGFGFGVWRLGVWVRGLGFEVWDLNLGFGGFWDVGFGVWGSPPPPLPWGIFFWTSFKTSFFWLRA